MSKLRVAEETGLAQFVFNHKIAVMDVVFVSFATANFRHVQAVLCTDALSTGVVSRVADYNDAVLTATEEYRTLPGSIRSGRAFGYFWWKPYIIRKTLDSVAEGTLVFYSDCGRYDGGFRLGKEFKWLVERHSDRGFVGVEVPQFGPNARWTKMDCFLGLSKNVAADMELPQIQATFSLWKNSESTRAFVREWEEACRRPELLTDDASVAPNDARFIAHRHDQSILTLLARQYDKPYLTPVARWEERLFIQKLARMHEANVSFKQVKFVAWCLRCGCASPLLAWLYFRRKSKVAVGRGR